MRTTWGRTRSAVLLGLVLLAACSGGGSGTDEQGAEGAVEDPAELVSDSETAETTPIKKPTYNDVKDPQGSVEGFVGAMKDVDLERCETDGDRLAVAGVVTNPTDSPQHYRIYVSAMESGDARGIVQVDLAEVAAGATESWETFFELDDTGLDCLMRVERFAPRG